MSEYKHEEVQKRKVLIINTGGTIGSKYTDKGYRPVAGFFESEVRSQTSLCDQKYLPSTTELEEFPFPPIALPVIRHHYRILYCIYEYDPVMDSCNMDMNDWATIANDIDKYYKQFDGFVILHGTDTMCYTASALSFMLECLGKSVVITGSQVPLVELRSDARDNMLGALLIAGEYVIPEVMIYFNSKLFRGNRCVKNSSTSLDAFSTPNIPPLAILETDINIDWDTVRHCSRTCPFHVNTNMVKDVGILRLFPGITRETIHAYLQPPMQGVVLQTYGAGNIPDTRKDLVEDLREASDRGVMIVNCTQCIRGRVSQNYAAGRILQAAGVLQGADMTPEAALTKLSYLLGRKDYSMKQKKELMVQNIRGEMTVLETFQQNFSLKDSIFVKTIASALQISTSKEIHLLRRHMFPPLMCMAAAEGDNDTLENLRKQGGDFSIANYDGRTPLHVACCEGHLNTVRLLLENGASVHVRDRFNHTPLTDAIKFKKFDVIKLLIQTGAHLVESSGDIATMLCKAAAEDDVDCLYAWHLAGANFFLADHENRTAIQVANEKNSKKATEFILKNSGKHDVKDHTNGMHDDMVSRLSPVSLKKHQYPFKKRNGSTVHGVNGTHV